MAIFFNRILHAENTLITFLLGKLVILTYFYDMNNN